MGCCQTTGVVDDDKKLVERRAAEQRRRLSVAPQHVGDITKVEMPAKSPSDNQDPAHPESHENKVAATSSFLVHASLSRKGFVPYNANKVNQDREVVAMGLKSDPGLHLFGVMDGHGEFGHEVSQFCKEWLPVYLEQEAVRDDPQGAIERAVKRLTGELTKTNINTAFSGTTAVFGLFVDKKLYVANIGDSRCVLCTRDGNGTHKAVGMSTDQKPENPEEKARILSSGGRVETLPGAPGDDNGPYRVWLKDVDVPGLAMSRSIGDEVSHTVGVISDPVIQQRQLEDNDAYVMWASDGVWEFISNESACKITEGHMNRGDLSGAVKALVQEAHKQWTQQEDVVDDITVVIVRLLQQPK